MEELKLKGEQLAYARAIALIDLKLSTLKLDDSEDE